MELFAYVFCGNTLFKWTIALGATLAATVLFHYLKRVLLRRLIVYAKTPGTPAAALVLEIFSGTRSLFLLILAVYTGVQFVTLPARAGRLVEGAVVVALLLQAALWGNRALVLWPQQIRPGKQEMDAASATTLPMLSFIGRLALWAIAGLMILANLGLDITALVAGLGIGGIAAALAVQNILGDIFASLSIAIDQPFVIGDFITVGDLFGTVEHIGLKTTRLRSLSGEQIIFSNTDLLASRIHNLKRMDERRVAFHFRVVYETPPAKLERIPGLVREIIEAQDKARFGRAHFNEYGEFSLHFEVVYFVNDPDYNRYMDIQQAINLALYRRFQEEGVQFAYPTHTLYINRRNGSRDDHSGGNG